MVKAVRVKSLLYGLRFFVKSPMFISIMSICSYLPLLSWGLSPDWLFGCWVVIGVFSRNPGFPFIPSCSASEPLEMKRDPEWLTLHKRATLLPGDHSPMAAEEVSGWMDQRSVEVPLVGWGRHFLLPWETDVGSTGEWWNLAQLILMFVVRWRLKT